MNQARLRLAGPDAIPPTKSVDRSYTAYQASCKQQLNFHFVAGIGHLERLELIQPDGLDAQL